MVAKPITIKGMSKTIGVSENAVKKGIVDLLVVLPVRKRVVVMEYMLYCKQLKSGSRTISHDIYTYQPKQKKIEIKV